MLLVRVSQVHLYEQVGVFVLLRVDPQLLKELPCDVEHPVVRAAHDRTKTGRSVSVHHDHFSCKFDEFLARHRLTRSTDECGIAPRARSWKLAGAKEARDRSILRRRRAQPWRRGIRRRSSPGI